MTNTILDNNGENLAPQDSRPVKTLTRAKKRLIFYICIIALPLLHSAIFFVYIHFDTWAMAFKEFYTTEGVVGMQSRFVGFKNFGVVLDFFRGTGEHFASVTGAANPQWDVIWKSFIIYGASLTFIPVALCFSYYIYKAYKFANLFRVILYLPSILSGTVMTLIYRMMFEHIFGVSIELPQILIYNFWMSFGQNVILYVGAMCGINVSIAESAQLDGATAFKEFWYITLPMIYPTIVTFLVMGLAGLFNNQANLYTFFGGNAPFQTMGYLYFVQYTQSGLIPNYNKVLVSLSYPQLSALGLVLTAIVLPTTLTVRHFLEKYGPSDH